MSDMLFILSVIFIGMVIFFLFVALYAKAWEFILSPTKEKKETEKKKS